MKTIAKILTALAAVAGAVYVIATFGDKIVAWAQKMLPTCEPEVEVEVEVVADTEDAPVEEAPAEEAPAEDAAEEAAPVAEEADFEA